MGALDEAAFGDLVRGCVTCGGGALDIASYIDRRVSVMLAQADDDGVWSHDGEKFVDGTYRIACPACAGVAFAADDCPRCHAAGGLARALETPSRVAVPKRCPECNGTELLVHGMTPAAVRYTAGARPPPPTPRAGLDEPGFHVVAIECDGCGVIAEAAGCPLCDAPGPLRDRP
jgi:hypothetical protein